jgi:hypothetical protein
MSDAQRAVTHYLGSLRLVLTALGLLLSSACTGVIGSPGEGAANGGKGQVGNTGSTNGVTGGSVTGQGGSATTDCSVPSPGSAPLRRLSNAEYRNTMNDLFPGVPDIANLVASTTREFPAEAESLGFRNNAQFLTVQTLTAQKYMDAAEAVAEKAATSPGVVNCTPAAGREMECAKSFIQDFGNRAYRRPLNAEETTRYEAQFQTALTGYGFSTGVEWTVFSMLQAPAFLYRVERGAPSESAVTKPTPDEMASRLSYLFWQSMPDAELRSAANSGALSTPQQIAARARQMLADPRAARLFQYFAEWLDLDRLDDFSRDEAVFKGLPQDLPRLYQDETRAFVSALLSRPDGNLAELLTAPYTYANQSLATFYGLSGPTGTRFERVDDPRRSGVLTQAFLMAQDKPYRTSIVRRGLKVRTDLLCQRIPAPPNNVQLNLDSLDPSLSQRERLAQHRQDPNCAGCHNLLDPVGLVFENFDAVGRYRTVDEASKPIVSSSELIATRDADGPIADVRELGARLAGSTEARDCYITENFRFFFGRDVEGADSCSIGQLGSAFQSKNLSLSELLVALTQTDAFLYRKTLEVSP